METESNRPAPRSIGEYIVLASLGASLAYWGYVIAFGSLTFDGSAVGAILQLLVFMGLGAVALVLLLKRKPLGVVLSMVFYAIQLVELTFASGQRFNFNSLPTIYFRVFRDEVMTVNVNVLSLILFVFSWILLGAYRKG